MGAVHGPRYVYLPDHDANRLSIGEFWRNITDFSTEDHHMSAYLSNFEAKVQIGAFQVPYFGLLGWAEGNAGQPVRPGG